MKALPWLVAALVLTGAWYMVAGARDEAMRERGRVEELIRQRVVAEDIAAAARLAATQMADSVVLARMHTDSVRTEARQRVAEARRSAEDASGRLRTLLDSLGGSTAPLDALEEAHAVEVAAKDSVIAAQDREIVALKGYAEVMVLALDAADERSLALAAERDSYKRQAEAWSHAVAPSLFKRASGWAVALSVGYLAGTALR